jgi:DNA-binding MarR family transcriptional regulator
VEVVNSLRRLFKTIHEYSKATQKKVGLSSPQVWALNCLGAEPHLSLGELAARMFAHPSTVSGVVERLRARGAVARAVDRDDRRGVRLSLTPLGRRLLRKSPSPVQSCLWEALRGMGPSRLKELRSSLELIARKTEAHRVRAPFFDIAS